MCDTLSVDHTFLAAFLINPSTSRSINHSASSLWWVKLKHVDIRQKLESVRKERYLKGFANKKFPHKSKITMEVGPGLTRNFYFFEKSSQNSHKPVLIFLSSIPCVFCLSIANSCWLL